VDGSGAAPAARRVLIEVAGTYGGRAARDEILRSLKEALALVENVAAEAELASSGFRIEVLREPARDTGARPA
jgi:hypothetical protein